MFKKDAQKILQETKRSLIEQYFDIQQLAESYFGEDTVVCIEIGSFFEIYGIDTPEEKIGKPKEIAELLNVQLTRKNKTIPENSLKNPLLAGFPTAAYERYTTRMIQENRYTIIFIRQSGTPPHITRFVDRIISPGINFDFALDHQKTCTTSLLFSIHNGVYSIGYAAMEVTTGSLSAAELQSTKEDPTRALDELFTLLQTYRSVEYLITIDKTEELEFIQNYLELHTAASITIREKRASLAYQNTLLQKLYHIESLLSPIEYLDLERSPFASEALTLLCDFIIEHDAEILTDLQKPIILSNTRYLYLGNNPLEQLHIISENPHERTILKQMDYTLTSGGKRLLHERLTHPLTHAQTIEERYELVESVKEQTTKLSSALKEIYDIERIARRIALKRLHPFELNFLHSSLQAAQHIIGIIPNTHPLLKTLHTKTTAIGKLSQYITTVFDLENTGQMSRHEIARSFFQDGHDAVLDEYQKEHKKIFLQLDSIRKKITSLFHEDKHTQQENYVLLKKTEKEGYFFSVTKNRYRFIEEELENAFITIDETVYAFSDFSYSVQTGTIKITGSIIDTLSEKITALEQKIIAQTKDVFLKELLLMHEHHRELFSIMAHTLSAIDVAYSTAIAAKKHRLYRPTIIEPKDNKAFIEALGIRHTLVEENQDHGIYVPNDIILGDTTHISKAAENSILATLQETPLTGMLLYGINSSGKSSLMKSIGISIILAQSGFFVPSHSFRYTIFTELCTRITAKDAMSKGLSSFAVEMLEMKNIFTRCGPLSMVLGDEVSHGTETTSAIAIVAAAILRLSHIGGLFVFATHLHQLQKIEEVQQLQNIACMHVSIRYDKETKEIIFDRTLKSGNGIDLYGLEFAQSLALDEKFLEYALRIRTTLTNTKTPLQALQEQKTSAYNRSLFLITCALCHNAVEDTHHIREQHTADEDGFIDDFPKDHKGNIVPLCKACHLRIHKKEISLKGYVMTTKGLILDVEKK